MNKVFFDVGITLDGYIAGPNGGAKNPLGEEGIKIHDWMFKQKAFLNHLNLEGGETKNKDNDIIEETFIVLNGKIEAIVDGITKIVEGGKIMMVPPNTWHEFKNCSDDPLLMVSIHPVPKMIQEAASQ